MSPGAPPSPPATRGDAAKLVPRPLFGGAVAIALPEPFFDVSPVRQIPDNQEVFVTLDNDQSVIVELLELEAETDDGEAARFHFTNLAEANDATGEAQCDVLRVETLSHADLPHFPAGTAASLLTGRQLVSKFDKAARDVVDIYLGVVRLRAHATDLLVSFNVPRPADDLGLPAPMDAVAVREALKSLVVLDYGLFGQS